MSGGRTWGTVIGAVVGYFIPVIGIAAGAAIGGAIGGMLEPSQKVETGRLDDLRVSVSQYGVGIPETWGNDVPPAQWVWTTDIIQQSTTESQGKGGGPEVTTFRQYVHGYLVLGTSPIGGATVQIRKAWIDGKLNYDASTGLSVGQALATEESPFTQLQVFDGNDSQMPHSVMEFYEGVGNVPAYRGLIGVFIYGLECPGGRIPQLSFEVLTNPSVDTEVSILSQFEAPSPNFVSVNTSEGAAFFDTTRIGGDNASPIYTIGPDYAVVTNIGVSSYSNPLNNQTYIPVSGSQANPQAMSWRRDDLRLQYYTEYLLQMDPGRRQLYDGADIGNVQSASYDEIGEIWAVQYTSNAQVIVLPVGAFSPIISSATCVAHSIYNNRLTLAYRPSASLEVRIRQFSVEGIVFTQTADFTFFTPLVSTGILLYENEHGLYARVQDIDGDIYKIEGTEKRYLGSSEFASDAERTFYSNDSYGIIGPDLGTDPGDAIYRMVRYAALTPQEFDIADVIESQAAKVEVDAVDVSTIDDTAWGYTFNKNPASARNNIVPLMTYAGIIQVEEDGLIRFTRRADKTSVATIPFVELGSSESGSESTEPFAMTMTEEVDCPRAVTIQYRNPTFDYQTSTETAKRIVTDSDHVESIALDIAMFPDKAATIAHRMLYEKWLARQTRTMTLMRKYAYLSPGDVVTVEYPQDSFSNWMLAKVNDTGAVIECECAPADAELISQNVPGTNGYTPQQLAPLAPPTRLTIVDSAILQDADNNAGVYAAMAGLSSGWRGAELFAGDDASSLQSRGTVSTPAVQGFCETTLANYQFGNVDEFNILVVNVSPGQLSSITRDELLNGTSNVAAVGAAGRWEIIKFQRAEDLGGSRYELSGLLRGLQGTEWAALTHVSGDTFVLMSDGGVLRPNFDAGTIGQTKSYKAVSLGRRMDSAQLIQSTNTGEGLETLAPTTPRKTFSSNDIILSFGRRSRLSNQWWLGNVQLGEESDRFEVDIYSNSSYTTVVRTLTGTSSNVTYTSAQQVADFGSNQTGTLYYDVYQISGTVGRGHVLRVAN